MPSIGIDEPGVRPLFASGFLAEHRVLRKRCGEARADQRFDGVIGGADEVLRPLGFGGECNFAPKIAQGERPGLARESFAEFGAGANILRRHATAIGTTP